jgi:hypothetical protein
MHIARYFALGAALIFTTTTPILSTSVFKPSTETEQKAYTLLQQFADLENHEKSWECFALELAHILKQEPQYHEVAQELEDISNYKSLSMIGLTLMDYAHLVPQELIQEVSQSYSVDQLKEIMEKRIKQNEQVTCSPELYPRRADSDGEGEAAQAPTPLQHFISRWLYKHGNALTVSVGTVVILSSLLCMLQKKQLKNQLAHAHDQ